MRSNECTADATTTEVLIMYEYYVKSLNYSSHVSSFLDRVESVDLRIAAVVTGDQTFTVCRLLELPRWAQTRLGRRGDHARIPLPV